MSRAKELLLKLLESSSDLEKEIAKVKNYKITSIDVKEEDFDNNDAKKEGFKLDSYKTIGEFFKDYLKIAKQKNYDMVDVDIWKSSKENVQVNFWIQGVGMATFYFYL